jgi:hypothetical protein
MRRLQRTTHRTFGVGGYFDERGDDAIGNCAGLHDLRRTRSKTGPHKLKVCLDQLSRALLGLKGRAKERRPLVLHDGAFWTVLSPVGQRASPINTTRWRIWGLFAQDDATLANCGERERLGSGCAVKHENECRVERAFFAHARLHVCRTQMSRPDRQGLAEMPQRGKGTLAISEEVEQTWL